MDVFWSMLVFFLWFAWLLLLFRIFADIFRRHDISGWGKAAWSIFVIFLPFLGVLIYLIAEGSTWATATCSSRPRTCGFRGVCQGGRGEPRSDRSDGRRRRCRRRPPRDEVTSGAGCGGDEPPHSAAPSRP